MEGEGTGNVCGQKLEGAGPLSSEPAAASTDTDTIGPSDDPAQLTAAFLAAQSRQAWGLHDLPHDTEVSDYEDANTEDALGRFRVAETPERIAAPPDGMSLPSWLKLIFRPVHMMGIDYELLASTYYRFFKAPHIPETALVSMLKKVFGDHVERREQQGGQWIVGLRWATRDEALDALGVQVVNMVSSKITEMGGIVERVRGYMVEYNGLTKLVDFQTMERDQQTNERAKQKAAASSKLIKRKRQTPPPPPPPDLPDSPPPPPPRDIETDLENVKASSDWRDIFEWLNESITADIGDNDALEAELEVADVYLALRKKYAEELLAHPAVASIDIPLMNRILHQVFPSSTLRASEEARYVGLAWRVLEHPVKSLVVGSKAVPERAHKLLHIPDPERTQLWLRTLFKTNSQYTISLPALCIFYQSVMRRWNDTHPHLNEKDFRSAIQKTFPKCHIIEVSEGYHVVHGIWLVSKPVTPEFLLHRRQVRQLHRLNRIEPVDPPKTYFALKLLDDPLLMTTNRDNYEEPMPGTFTSRLRRRGGSNIDQRDRAREPFGDEEPGFPGVSMKRVNRWWRKNLKEQHQIMREEEERDAAEATAAVTAAASAAQATGF